MTVVGALWVIQVLISWLLFSSVTDIVVHDLLGIDIPIWLDFLIGLVLAVIWVWSLDEVIRGA